MKYIYVLILLIACSSCSIEGKWPSFSSDFLPPDIEGFHSTYMLSGSGTDQNYCETVDMGDYYRANPDGSINKNEHVSAVICQSPQPGRQWQREVADLYETSKDISSFQLMEGITGKYYSPFNKHVYILWQDGNFICHVSSMSESGNGHEISVTIANAMIMHLRTLRSEGSSGYANGSKETG